MSAETELETRDATEQPIFTVETDLEAGDITDSGTRGPAQPPETYFTTQETGDDSVLYTLNTHERVPSGPSRLPETITKGRRRRKISIPEADFNPDAILVLGGAVARGAAAPAIQQRLIDFNFDKGRFGQKITAICDHIMQDNLTSVDGFFHGKNAGASSHYGVGTDGTIYQWVKDEDMAWGNGLGYEADGRPYVLVGNPSRHLLEKPDLNVGWINQAVQNRINPNYLTISIEHAGHTGDKFTEAQYQATLQLHRFLIDKYGIPPLRDHIVGHYQISGVNKPFCPGTGFPWDRLMADLGMDENGNNKNIPLIQVSYQVTIPTAAMVRPGPSTSFTPAIKKVPGADRKFTVIGEAKGEIIFDTRRNRPDDTWAFFHDLDGATGFVTRTALDW